MTILVVDSPIRYANAMDKIWSPVARYLHRKQTEKEYTNVWLFVAYDLDSSQMGMLLIAVTMHNSLLQNPL